RRHPGVVVGADAAFTPDEVVQKVREGVCELGLVGAPGSVQAPGVDVLPLESQSFVLVGADGADFPGEDPISSASLAGARLIASPPGSQMRRIVDEMVASGAEIVVEVAHRTSILPLVLQGVGFAVLPSAWAPLARRSGARAVRIDSRAQLHVALISRSAPLTPAARAFLDMAGSYTPVDHLEQQA